MKKRTVTLAVILMIFLAVFLLTGKQSQPSGGTGSMNNVKQKDLTARQANEYSKYDADLSGFLPAENYTVLDFLVEKTEFLQEENNITIYKSVSLEKILPMCSEITEICKINSQFYISFTATDGNYITLTFDKQGMISKDVYSSDTDTYVMVHRDYAYMIKDFRY